jgi:hypothetical protein
MSEIGLKILLSRPGPTMVLQKRINIMRQW